MSEQKSAFGQSDIVRLSDEDAAVELLERAVTGGDCRGLNAVIRAVSKAAAKRDSRETFHLLAAFSFHHRHILGLDESLIRLQEGFCYDYSSLF
jgi:hypothetical protein